MNLEDLRANLETASPEDDAIFHILIAQGLELLHIQDIEFAHELGTPVSTITRWRTGVTLPHPALRPKIYERLKNRIDAGR